MWSDRFLRPPLHVVAVVLFALVCCPPSARCEVSVRGTAAAVLIEARQATLPQVLGALETSFKVRYDTLIALDDIIVSGTYSGALEDVLRRALAGLDYVIRMQEGTVEIMVVGRRGSSPAAIESKDPGTSQEHEPRRSMAKVRFAGTRAVVWDESRPSGRQAQAVELAAFLVAPVASRPWRADLAPSAARRSGGPAHCQGRTAQMFPACCCPP
jgi:hypothetical protein